MEQWRKKKQVQPSAAPDAMPESTFFWATSSIATQPGQSASVPRTHQPLDPQGIASPSNPQPSSAGTSTAPAPPAAFPSTSPYTIPSPYAIPLNLQRQSTTEHSEALPPPSATPPFAAPSAHPPPPPWPHPYAAPPPAMPLHQYPGCQSLPGPSSHFTSALNSSAPSLTMHNHQHYDLPPAKRSREEGGGQGYHSGHETGASSPPPGSAIDVVDLNVRGQIITVKRNTLCHVPGSLLELMFSGRWDAGLDRDPSGRVFLEFNPACFQQVVDALSHARAHDEQPPLASPHVPSELLPEFLSLVQYLGLQDALQPAVRCVGLRFNATQGNLLLRERRRLAEVPPTPSPASLPAPTIRAQASALAVPLLPTGTSFWKIYIHSLDTTYYHGMFIGVTSAPLPGAAGGAGGVRAPQGYTPTCHGWQAAGGVIAQGQLVGDRKDFEGFEEGDNVVMRLEAHRGVLTMAVDRLPGVYQLQLRGGGGPGGSGGRWQVVCLFFTEGNCVELMDPLPHEADWLAGSIC